MCRPCDAAVTVVSPAGRQVPLLPYLPMLSVLVNVYLMMKLGSATWIRFGIWMILGETSPEAIVLPARGYQHPEHPA